MPELSKPLYAETTLDEHAASALDAAIACVQAGQYLDREALLEKHPDLAGPLAALSQLVKQRTERANNATPVPSGLPEQIGPFQVERELGSGGFGVVYLAFDPDVRRKIALKVLHPGRLTQPEAVRRFQREAQATARLQHPGIVRLFDYSRQGPPYYLVTEYVEGIDPRLWCKEHGGDAATMADLVARIAEAVDHAHAQGIYHRDLKPGNILIDATGEPHILDFGLARLDALSEMMPSAPTSEGHILGSLSYMAPEQAAGQSHTADARSDVYSLGVILYELLTGRLPFEGPAHALLGQVVENMPPAPRSIDASVPPDLEAICMKALAKRPDERYSSAAALGRDLRSFLRGEPVEARRLTPFLLLQRFLGQSHREVRQHGWTLLLMLLGAVIFIGCAIMNYLENTLSGESRWLPLLLTKGLQVAIMLWIVVRLRPVKGPGLTAAERQIWSLIPGYYGGFLTLLVLNGFLREPIPLAPVLAVMSGMGFATLGATIWGGAYVCSLAFFGLALIMAATPAYGLTLLGFVWLLCLSCGSLHFRWTK